MKNQYELWLERTYPTFNDVPLDVVKPIYNKLKTHGKESLTIKQLKFLIHYYKLGEEFKAQQTFF